MIDHSMLETIVIILSAFSLLCLAPDMIASSSNINVLYATLKSIFVFKVSLLDFMSLMWINVSLEMITKSLYFQYIRMLVWIFAWV